MEKEGVDLHNQVHALIYNIHKYSWEGEKRWLQDSHCSVKQCGSTSFVMSRKNIMVHKKTTGLNSFDKDLIRRKVFDACANKEYPPLKKT